MTVAGSMVGGYTDAMSRLRLRVASPQKAVMITASGGSGVTVTIRPDAMCTLTAEGMASEVAAAVEAVLAGYARAQTMALEQTVDTGAQPAGPRAADQRRRIAEIDVVGSSPDNTVRLIRRGDDGAIRAVVARSGMNGTAEQLAAAVHRAMTSLAGEHRRARVEVYMRNAREVLSTAPVATPKGAG